MKRNWLGLVMLLMVALFALACGSSSDNAPATTFTYGSVDSSLDYGDISKAELLPISNGTAQSSGVIEDSEINNGNGDDHRAVFQNVSNGDYLFRVSGGNSTLYTTLFEATVSVSSNVISGLGKATPAYFQANPLTTFIVSQAAGNLDFTSSLNGLVEAVLSGNSLEDVYYDGGVLINKSNGKGAGLQSTNVMSSINYVALVIKSVSKITSSDNTTLVDNAITLLKEIALAGDDMSALETATGNAVLGQIFSATSANVTEIKSVVGEKFVSELIGNSSSLSSFEGITAGNLQAAAVAATDDSFEIESFALADSNFGSTGTSANQFILKTLAPVFKVTFANNVNQGLVGSAISVDLEKVGGGSYSLSLDDATVVSSWASATELYLAVKADGLSISSKELEPGAVYNYTLNTSKFSGNTQVGNYGSGNIAVEDLTITSPKVPVAFAGTSFDGLMASEVLFNVNASSSYTVSGNSTDDYGFYLWAAGEVTGKQIDGSYFQLTDIDGNVVSVTNGSKVTEGTITLTSSVQGNLESGEYNLEYQSNSTQVVSGTLKINIK